MALTWTGDGATKHRRLSTRGWCSRRARRRCPLIVVIQNNQVALGTRLDQHGAGASGGRSRRSTDVTGLGCDGNNVLDVYAATALAPGSSVVRGEGPVVIVAETFRMGGHATHDEREARETFAVGTLRALGAARPGGTLRERTWSDGGVAVEEIEAGRGGSRRHGSGRRRRRSGRWPHATTCRRPEQRALPEGISEGGVLHGLRDRLGGGARCGHCPLRLGFIAMFENLRRKRSGKRWRTFNRELRTRGRRDRRRSIGLLKRDGKARPWRPRSGLEVLEGTARPVARKRAAAEEAREAEVCEPPGGALARKIGDADTADDRRDSSPRSTTTGSRVLSDKAKRHRGRDPICTSPSTRR